jgi:hypothetical protein
MAGICIFATTTKVFDYFLITYFFAVNLYFAILRIFIYFRFGENVPKSFSQLKNILEKLSLKLISQMMIGNNGLLLRLWKKN